MRGLALVFTISARCCRRSRFPHRNEGQSMSARELLVRLRSSRLWLGAIPVRRREFSRLLSSLPFALAFPAAAQQSEQERREAAEPAAPSAAAAGANAFFEPWERPFGLPPFDRISVSDYAPAFERAMVEQNAEIAAIAADTRPPDFDNAIAAQQRAGQAISRVGGVFWNLIGTE